MKTKRDKQELKVIHIPHVRLHDMSITLKCLSFFFNDTATTEIYTLSLHDALPILRHWRIFELSGLDGPAEEARRRLKRSEEHTSELQSRGHLVCRLLLEKKKN